MRSRLVATLLVALGPFVIAACGDDTTTLRVMAASSLSGAFADMETAFERENPNVDVVVITASSSTLAGQIVDGADVDVFASADDTQFARAADAVNFDPPRVLASNSLVIIVPRGNPRMVEGLDDLARDDVLVATATDDVPIRKYTDRLLEAVGVTANFVTFEANVSGIVTKVSTGSADAGIVYASDLIGAEVDAITIPADDNLTVTYPIAANADSSRADLARRWVEFTSSEDGLAILGARGFAAP
jgi:molybdate transport system substrate-binding protein